jgi:competence protein ComEC
MATAWLALRDTLRRIGGARIFPAAVLTALVLDPSLVASTGFHLSVSAVAGISVMARRERSVDGVPLRRRAADAVRLTLGAQAGVLPVQMAVFGTITPLAMPVNVLAVPLLGLWLPSVPVAIGMGFVGGVPEQVAGAFTEGAGRILLWWIFLWSSLPGMMQAVRPWTSLAAAAGLIGWARGGRGRLVALAALAVTVWSPHLDRGVPRVTFLDVGQGDAIVLETRAPRRVVVIDAGPAWSAWNAGEAVVAAYLRSREIRTIDLLVASHSDADHVGGMTALIERFEIGAFMRGDWVVEVEGAAARLAGAVADAGIPVLLPDGGDRLALARETWIDVLAGARTASGGAGVGSENDRSLVLRVEMNGVSIVLPGDLEVTGERRLHPFSRHLRCDILKVAHHGSGDSSSPRFLELTRPELAVISVGRNNRHGHPDPALVEKLESSGIEVWRTDSSGALVLRPRR